MPVIDNLNENYIRIKDVDPESIFTIELQTGATGSKGSKGDTGETGPQGEQGPQGETGPRGSGIASIEKTSTSGLVDTYTITYEDGDTSTFEITNGANGENGTNGLDGIDGINGIDGKNLEFNWDGTKLGVRVEGEAEYSYVDLKGPKGDNGTNGTNGVDGEDGFSPTITATKVGKVTTLTITDIDGTKTATILDGEDGSSSGDMLKSTYDTNNNGIVDNAEKVNNHTVNADVPADAKFTDTTYTAGTNITINDNVISSTDTTYTAGTNITIDGNNVISATDTTYTAGDNITINNNVISATDTTYTAGTGIDITSGVISNTQTSAEWGNITGTLTDQTDLNNALNNKPDKKYAYTVEGVKYFCEIGGEGVTVGVGVSSDKSSSGVAAAPEGTFLSHAKSDASGYRQNYVLAEDDSISMLYAKGQTQNGVIADGTGARILGLKTPTSDSDATTKKYVDDAIADAITNTLGGAY